MIGYDSAPSLDDSNRLLPAQPDAISLYLGHIGHGPIIDVPISIKDIQPDYWTTIRPVSWLQSDDPDADAILDWYRHPEREDNDECYGKPPEYDRHSIHSGNDQYDDEQWQRHIDGNRNPTK